jgi:hypothetical protein
MHPEGVIAWYFLGAGVGKSCPALELAKTLRLPPRDVGMVGICTPTIVRLRPFFEALDPL